MSGNGMRFVSLRAFRKVRKILGHWHANRMGNIGYLF
jgi:hypothetical protein